MCMTLALATNNFALVAADTRYTFADSGAHDTGEKIRRIPGGWTGATGKAAVMLLGFRTAELRGEWRHRLRNRGALRQHQRQRRVLNRDPRAHPGVITHRPGWAGLS